MCRAISYKKCLIYDYDSDIYLFISQISNVIGTRFLHLSLQSILVTFSTGYAIKRREINILKRQKEIQRK